MSVRHLARVSALALLLALPTFATLADAASNPSAQPSGIVAVKNSDAMHPWILSGALSTPSKRDAEMIAREVLATHASWTTAHTLVHARTIPFADGTRIVAFDQKMDGVPVMSRGVRATIDADGRTTMLTTVLEERRPSSLVPKLTDDRATRLAFDDAKMRAESTRATLLVVPGSLAGGEPRLCWAIVGSFAALPFRPVVLVDAHSGAIVRAWDAAVSAGLAKVYDQNPIKTPTLKDVTLTNDPAKEGLENQYVTARNCIDTHKTKSVTIALTSLTVHVCELQRSVKPNTTGDYVDILPDKDGAREDPYSELSMFFHTNKAYEFAKSIGFPVASTPTQLTAVANLRVPDGYYSFDIVRMANPTTDLLPFDNAFYSPKDPIFSTLFGVESDAMWFGQGGVDFAYDGDVVYHEFGHFLVNQTLKLGFGAHADPYGLSYSPGAMNEGIADLFSTMITDDPLMGEYSATAFPTLKLKATRDLENTFKFPDAITGEVHQDSEPFTAAVWSVYKSLDATKKASFQRAFMKALMSSPSGDLSFSDFGVLLGKSIATIDPALETQLIAAMTDRGMGKDDPRVRTYADPGVKCAVRYLGIHSPSKRAIGPGADHAPGIVQIRYDAPAGGETTLHLLVDNATRAGVFGSSSGSGAFGGGGTFVPRALAKSGSPIKYTYGPLAHDATAGDCAMAADKKSFACDVTLNVPGTWGTTAPVHVMIVNVGDADGDYDNVRITAEGPPEPPPPTETEDDAGPPAAQPSDSKSGCGCTIPRDEEAPAGALLATLGLALALRRRKSRLG